MPPPRLLLMILGPLVLVPVLLWSGRFLGKEVAFGLVGLLAVVAVYIPLSWMRQVSRERIQLMRRLGFTLAPEAAAALSRNTRLGKLVTRTAWSVPDDRAFHGMSFGVPVTYFDAQVNVGGDHYNAATVVGAHQDDLSRAASLRPRPLPRKAGTEPPLKVIESEGTLFCFRPDHMVPDNELAILDFLQEAVAALFAEAERRRASR